MLSGGASRGAAQAGMMRALMRNGVIPDAFVAGSVGSLNAVFLAQDVTLEQVDRLEDIYRRLGNFDLIGPPHLMVMNVLRHQPSLASGRRIREFIASCCPVERIEDLTRPVRVATFDVDDGRFTWHDAGNVVDVVAASCALPAIYPPVEIDGHLHVDYGVRFSVPTDAAVDMVRRGDVVWSMEVNRTPLPTRMRSPWDTLMIVAGSSIAHNSVLDFPAGVTVHRIVLDRAFDTGFPFNFRHTSELVRMGEESAEAALEAAGLLVAPVPRLAKPARSEADLVADPEPARTAGVRRLPRLAAAATTEAVRSVRASAARVMPGTRHHPATERIA